MELHGRLAELDFAYIFDGLAMKTEAMPWNLLGCSVEPVVPLQTKTFKSFLFRL